MKKIVLFITLSVLLMVGNLALAQNKKLVLIKEWSGSGITQTEIFKVPSEEWVIIWGTSGPRIGHFEIMSFRKGSSPGNADDIINGYITTVAFEQKPGKGAYNMVNGPGDYYLRIATGGFSWIVRVYAYK